MTIRALLIVLVLAVASPSAAVSITPADVKGPDVPTVTAPDHVVKVFDHEHFTCTEQNRTRTVNVPTGQWDRIILEMTYTPVGDPWDRLFHVAIGGVEVLRGTSARTEMTLRKDITEYASLLPAGGDADVTLTMGSYVGAVEGTVVLEWYGDEPTAPLVRRPVASAQGIFYRVPLPRVSGVETIRTATTSVAFGAGAPARAFVEMTLSSHGRDEVWFQNGPLRGFHLYLDDVEIANVYPHPYRYAFFGFGNQNANTACVGPGTAPHGDILHPVMWWTAQRVADAAGVHTGPGEILAHRVEIDAALLPLLTGTRTARLWVEGGFPYWPVSVSIITP